MVSSRVKPVVRALRGCSTGLGGGTSTTEFITPSYNYCYFLTASGGKLTTPERTSGSDRCVRDVPPPSDTPY